MKKLIPFISLAVILSACSSTLNENSNKELKEKIKNNEDLAFVKTKALEVVKTGFNAGDGYGEVWIRDYNTFIELSSRVYDKVILKENLLVFFKMQGEDGNIIDGFIPIDKAVKSSIGYDYIYSDLEPRYAGHKNTVETDQESSLVQAVYKYIGTTGDNQFLNEIVGGKTVSQRLENSMEFLMNHRFSDKYGLIWGATTADWGDVQPEHDWGVYLTNDTHYAIDIYDNAMFLVALNNLIEMIPGKQEKLKNIRDSIKANSRKYLWDPGNQKFIPHIYLDGSPFPSDFNENEIFYHGGTAIAIEADLLTKEEIKVSLEKMISNVKASGAGSIGLTMYPPYPRDFFKNKGMYPYGYQNGGDWTWFGGRMIQQLIRHGMVNEAFEQIQPMLKRVKDNNGFFEWYTVDNKPNGSGTFRGEAGVLYKAIVMLYEWAGINNSIPPVEYVDPLIGTAPAATVSALRHSEAGSEQKGQTYPGVGRPFGTTTWTPETRTTELKCISPYYYNDNYITGFRGSHWMSGSCTQDYGSVTIMPFTSGRPDTIKKAPVSRFSHSNETSTPAYYSVMLDDFGVLAEMTGSVRSGMMRFGFPQGQSSSLFIRVNSDENLGKIWIDKERNEIAGLNPVHRIYQGRGQSAGFSGYFVIRFDKPFEVIPQNISFQNMLVTFGKETTLLVKIGTSFTSIEGARKNLDTEITDWNFGKLENETEEIWNNTLSKIQVAGGNREELIKFYTALYHCYQLPRIVSDVDGSYVGFAQDTLIHKAVGFDYYDDFTMWDTYRGLHPLMTIIEPEKSLDMVKSLVAKAEQGGWMPIFPLWGHYTAAMIGDHVSTMISDAYIKGIIDFDTEKAYKYMRQNAFDSPTREEYVDGKGRRALPSYIKYGYIPLEDSVWDAFHKREQVSRTLEYALDDYALAQFAKKLGKTSDYKTLIKRSKNYKNVFDTGTGYVRGRYADGRWIEPFDPNIKASFICEGTPFQYTWYVPHDVPGLIDLMGGKKAYLKKLNEFFDGGFYWHGNETDQQAPYMFAMAGYPSKTQEWTHRIIADEYGTGPGGVSGNDDAGQMSAWLVFSMIGFYSVCPASNRYILTTPSFDEIKIQLPDGKYFTSKTINRTSDNYYIRSVTKNGKKFKNNYLTHEEIMDGSQFIFSVSGKPGN